jgi:cyclophilin family peptidyl-prolyl cis-trans isomerase
MKKTAPLLLLTLLGGTAALRADDIALMHLRLPKDKGLKSVAIEFYPGDAPATVANFEKLARKKFFDGQSIHRAFPHLLIQAGDPYSRGRDRSRIGTGGPGYTLPAEIHRKHTAGAVAMARLPDKINPSRVSNGSQFYICLAPIPSYDGQYTVFGHVISGLDVLDTASQAAVDSNDNPIDKIVIKDIRIIPREKIPGVAQTPPPPAARPGPARPASAKPASATAKPAAAPAATPAPAKAKKPWWKIF